MLAFLLRGYHEAQMKTRTATKLDDLIKLLYYLIKLLCSLLVSQVYSIGILGLNLMLW